MREPTPDTTLVGKLPSDLLELFKDLGLPAPRPVWYVGRLDTRGPSDEKERES